MQESLQHSNIIIVINKSHEDLINSMMDVIPI